MNTKTAKHLNDLRKAAVYPEVVPKWDSAAYLTFGKNTAVACLAAIERHIPEGIAAMIRYAAVNRIEAQVYIGPAFITANQTGEVHCLNGAHKIAFEMALPEITAIVNQYNALATERYETYRIACEQGVAVPPPSTEQ